MYLYLVRYAEEQQDLALLSISTFQKGLKVCSSEALWNRATIILYITVTDNLEHSVINGCMKLLKISSANTTKHYFVATEQKEGDIGIFSFADLTNVWLGFSVFALENCGFSVLGSSAVCRFS